MIKHLQLVMAMIMVVAFCACNQVPGKPTGDSQQTCANYQQAIRELNKPVTEFEKGVFYAYYCE